MDDEPELISRAANGDQTALELLLYRNRTRLLGYVKFIYSEDLHGFFEPQDIMQDIWLRAIRAFPASHPPAPLYPWLRRIARNVVADHLKYVRRTKRARHRMAEKLGNHHDSVLRLLAELASYQKSPSKSAAAHELIILLEAALSHLPPDQSQAIRFRYLKGMDTKRVAQIMHRTEGSISMLCNRGLKLLRVELRSASFYI
jgi:RNA polymerase sigma-70 factor (ECF subfamily)